MTRGERPFLGPGRPSPPPAVLAFAIALALSACGYRLRGTGTSLPPQVRTLAVPMFKNLTIRYELDLKLTRAVVNELVARGKAEIVDDPGRADAVLEGEITGFRAAPAGFSRADQADKYVITVTAKVRLVERDSGRELFSNPSFAYQQEYDVPPGSSFEAVEAEALDRMAERFARSLVVAILEGF